MILKPLEWKILKYLNYNFDVIKANQDFQKNQLIYHVHTRLPMSVNRISFDIIFEHQLNDHKIILNDQSSIFLDLHQELQQMSIDAIDTLIAQITMKSDLNYDRKQHQIKFEFTPYKPKDNYAHLNQFIATLITLHNYPLIQISKPKGSDHSDSNH